MPNFDTFSLLECKKRDVRSRGKRKYSNLKHTICADTHINTPLNDLSVVLNNHGRTGILSFYLFCFFFLVSRDCCVALAHGYTGLSAVCHGRVFPDHTHLLYLRNQEL